MNTSPTNPRRFSPKTILIRFYALYAVICVLGLSVLYVVLEAHLRFPLGSAVLTLLGGGSLVLLFVRVPLRFAIRFYTPGDTRPAPSRFFSALWFGMFAGRAGQDPGPSEFFCWYNQVYLQSFDRTQPDLSSLDRTY